MVRADRRVALVRRLLSWYRKHKRDLPWRRTKDPYKILISEVMLQQTQVDRVIPKYKEFLKFFPTMKVLAASEPRQVRRMWYPLGYNARPLRLHALARETLAKYGGHLPRDPQELDRLPGIGPYTAGALASIAFGIPLPALDTNVKRVLGRVFYGSRRPADRILFKLASALIPAHAPGDFNQALMDLGAGVCRARRPRCRRCPMKPWCAAAPAFLLDPVRS